MISNTIGKLHDQDWMIVLARRGNTKVKLFAAHTLRVALGCMSDSKQTTDCRMQGQSLENVSMEIPRCQSGTTLG